MDDNNNNNPLFQQEFCLKQQLCSWARVSFRAESLRKHAIICSDNITYTCIISRQPYYLRRSVSNLEKKVDTFAWLKRFGEI